jgi:hypothetical protein
MTLNPQPARHSLLFDRQVCMNADLGKLKVSQRPSPDRRGPQALLDVTSCT